MTPRTTARPLTLRELNRALLDRQLLLRRSDTDPAAAVEHLVGLQTQVPGTHYTALFARLAGFDAAAFSARFEQREFVRISLLRSTIHTVTARDCLRLRPLLEVVQERPFRTNFGKRLTGLDLTPVLARARELAAERPHTFAEFGAALGREFPGWDEQALGMAVRSLLPMVQVPPRGLWQRGGAARHTTAERWLGEDPAPGGHTPDDLVLRYLAAFGPASVKDAQTWSGLTRLREVFDRLRPRLAVFAAPDGTELFDLPDAPRPDPDVPAPPRLLPEYDNLLLGHADRTRVVSAEGRARISAANRAFPVYLLDGFAAGLWKLETARGGAAATVTLTPFPSAAPTSAQRAALTEEATRVAACHAPGATDLTVRWESME